MKTPSLHSNFFSSLKQVEKRLKSDHPVTPPPPPLESCNTLPESLSSPMYLQFDKPIKSCTFQDSSEPPSAFLSSSQPFDDPDINAPPHQLITRNESKSESDSDPVDDIEMLIQLLGLSEEKGREMVGGGDCCDCEGGFYSKIVGFEGPKCGKEVERMEGWIKHYMTNGGKAEKLEPFRLAHLLLGKAVSVSQGSDCGFEGLEFPSTLDDFLQNDPPHGT